MGYKKYVKIVPTNYMRYGKDVEKEASEINMNRAKNLLPEMYQGSPNRLDRYMVYDNMEQDPVIASSLDILADYIGNIVNGNVFKLNYELEEIPMAHVKALSELLKKYERVNDFHKRIFYIVRDCLKYGDVFFIRNPDDGSLFKVNPYDVVGVVVGEIKEPKWYIIKNLDINAPIKVANSARNDIEGQSALQSYSSVNGPYVRVPNNTNIKPQTQPQQYGPSQDQGLAAIRANNVVHISLNIDNAALYPFGLSILENVYKLYIQKILIQDCVLMHRIKNAPDKLVFKIPVGNIPKMMRRSYLERCRNEMTQRRMPSKDSDGVFNTIDVSYNTVAMNEDYWLPVDAGTVQPSIEKLQGSNNLDQIKDLDWWDQQIIRGVHVPQSWQCFGTTDSQRTVQTTTASTLVQEERFYRYCNRNKYIISKSFDEDFKRFVKNEGYSISLNSFTLEFNDSSIINKMTELDLQSKQLSNFSSAVQVIGMSKRFAMKKYLGLTEEEYAENVRMYAEENPDKLKAKDIEIPKPNNKQIPGLRSIGASEISGDAMQAIRDAFDEGNGNSNNGAGGAGGFGGDLGMGSDLGGGDMGLGSESSDMGGGEAGMGSSTETAGTGE